MSTRKIWILSAAAFVISWFIVTGPNQSENLGISYHANSAEMTFGWSISDENGLLYENADFITTGSLKDKTTLILTKHLPATDRDSMCFTTVGYTVKAYLDGNKIYSFGSSPDGSDVWGVKTHIIKIPDGAEGRILTLKLATNKPYNIAVSRHVLLGGELEITDALLKSGLADMTLSILSVSIGFIMLLYSLISLVFRFKRFDISFFLLALTALFMGSLALAGTSVVTIHADPGFVFWITTLLRIALPIPALAYVAADKGFRDSRVLLAAAAVQCGFLCLWIVCKAFGLNLALLGWNQLLLIMISFVLFATLIKEFVNGEGRLEIFLSTAAIITASVLDAYVYYSFGDYYSMNYNLMLVTLPVLVLMTGKTVLGSVRRELAFINENTALRVQGDLLLENYERLDRHIDETKKIWHDIDRHFSAVSSLASAGEYDELDSYLGHLGHDMKKAKNSFLCDNRLINAILADKFAESERKGIQMSFAGNLPEKLHIQGNDVCSLLVNMLDNAIESCEKAPGGKEKTIEVVLGMKNDFVYFSVSNTADGLLPIRGGEFVTSKKDKAKHGYGISIMQRIVRKYDGAFDMIPSENSFLVRAALKNTPDNSHT